MPGLEKVANAVIDYAAPLEGTEVVDLGCGGGQLTLALAAQARSVLAVDFSEEMLRLLEQRAERAGLDNVRTVCSELQSLELPPASVDLVVSNYALHHLRHPEKAELLKRIARWLRPGGRVVIGDMMFGLVGDAAGRRVVAVKVASLARRGPGGWWRIAKNGWRLMVSRQECPASMETWERMLADAGLPVIRSERIVAEAAVISARRPAP